MSNNMQMYQIFDQSFLDVTDKVASIRLERLTEENVLADCPVAVEILTKGLFCSDIVCKMSNELFEAIIQNMNRGKEVAADERTLYIGEYMNIVCGQALSDINNRVGRGSRLSIPKVTVGESESRMDNQKSSIELYYDTSYGKMKVIVSYEIQNQHKEVEKTV